MKNMRLVLFLIAVVCVSARYLDSVGNYGNNSIIFGTVVTSVIERPTIGDDMMDFPDGDKMEDKDDDDFDFFDIDTDEVSCSDHNFPDID